VLELVDETFVVADLSTVRAAVGEPTQWVLWWPDLELTPFMDRGDLGVRWSAAGRHWVGSVELWLEAVGDGVLVHHYQRLDPAGGGSWSPTAVRRERERRALLWKRHAFALKDELEGGRRPGSPLRTRQSRTATDLPTTHT
jgi:hypothetical protein